MLSLFLLVPALAADPAVVPTDVAPDEAESSEAEPPEAEPSEAEPSEAGSTQEEAVGDEAAEAGPIVQTYAMRQIFTSQMRDPNPFSRSGWKSTRTHTWGLVQWTQSGTAVSYVEETCGLRTDKVFGATTKYTEAFLAAIPLRNRTATLSSTEAGARFTAGPYAQSFGVELDDPYNDPLPTSADDPRVVDTDKDGHPGATVVIHHPMVGTGEVYVAQRSIARLEGTIAEDGSVRGVIYTAPDMFKIGANRWWLRTESPQRQHPDPKESPFQLVPAPSDITCETIIRDADKIFGAL